MKLITNKFKYVHQYKFLVLLGPTDISDFIVGVNIAQKMPTERNNKNTGKRYSFSAFIEFQMNGAISNNNNNIL